MDAPATRASLRIVLWYALFAGLWIFLSDRALPFFVPELAPATALQTYKGWLFVAVTALLLFFLLHRKLHATLKRREERLRVQSEALQAAANAIVITDAEGNISWVNPAFTRLTGYSLEEVRGQNLRILKSGKQDSSMYHELWSTILAGDVWHGEIINRRKDGSLYTEEQTITPVRNEHGEISHFIAIKQDVSERVRRERELEAIAAMAYALRAAEDQRGIVSVTLDQLLALLGGAGAAAAMRNPITGETVIEQAVGELSEMVGQRVAPGEGISGAVIASGEAYTTRDVREDAPFTAADLLDGARAAACVPLLAQERTIGALWVTRLDEMTSEEVRLVSTVADMAANTIRRVTLHELTEQRLQRLATLHTIDLAISSTRDLQTALHVLLEQVISQLQVDAADVLLLNPRTNVLEYAVGRGFHTKGIERSRLQLGEGYVGRAALERRVIHISDLDAVTDFLRASLIAEEGFMTYYAVPLKVEDKVKGVLETFHRRKDLHASSVHREPEWVSFLEALGGQAAIAIDKAELFGDLQRSNQELVLAYDTTLEGWSRALELRDAETEGHTQRVVAMTEHLARAMGMSEEQLVHVRRGALLHDIGKIGIPDSILLKPGPLSEDEWEVMRMHPVHAYEMLSSIEYLRPALDIPYCHHERWDGTGYPRGLAGEQIPLAARIFAVVDVWDALTSDRPYRQAWSRGEALGCLRAEAGKHFDPQVVEVFLEMLGEA